MKNPLIPFCCLFIAFASGAYGQTQQEFKTTPTSVIGYIEYIPPDYYTNSFEYPVVIFLHGLGQRGPTSDDPKVLETGYHHLVSYGPPRLVKQGTQFPFILISPALKSRYGDWPGWYIMEVIEHVRTYLRIDPKRIYLTGSSLGGGGTWTAAQENPDYFAAIAPVAGSRNTPSKACGIANSNLPVWAFHGNRDTVVPLSRSVNMVNAINSCKPDIEARLTIYDGLGHNAHSYAYDLGERYHSPNLYWWMLSWENDLGNKVPVADAGPDVTVNAADKPVLAGKGTDPDGSITNYNWSKLKGGNVTFSGRTSASVTLSDLEVGTYVFRLTVRDNKGAITSDDITVTVSRGGNISPVANAGPDKLITLPTATVTLSGSGSDPDGSVSGYSWTKVSGGNAVLSGSNTAILTASSLEAGIYTFRLTVRDNAGATKSDDVKVVVNRPPAVSAGSDVSISLPANQVTLKATASDPDGTIEQYTWTKRSGPGANLSGSATAELKAANLVEGTYVFRITVRDDRGAEAYDEVTVTVVTPASSNVPPVAHAGADKIISLPENKISLSGSGSDEDGTIVSFAWTKVSGGAATLSGANTAKLVADGLEGGVYVFRLTVTDDKGAKASDNVTVRVNRPPAVSAGSDVSISLPANQVTLKATASDPDGTIEQYTWTKRSGPGANLSGSATAELKAANLVEGTYVFQITVRDDHGAEAYDEVTVTVVTPASSNVPPVAYAGADKIISLPENKISLSGSGSDADGTVVSFAWTKVSGGAATLSGANTAKLVADGLTGGVYVFRLTVTDDKGAKASDNVTVRVNMPPVVNAGADKIISLPTNGLTLTGSGTDPDGTITAFKWEKSSGGNAVMSGNATSALKLSGLTAGLYQFRLTVTDNHGATHSDDVRVVVNIPPVADAGPDREISALQNAITLNGKGADPDGTVVAFNWKKISGGTASFTDATIASPGVKDLQAGVYVFELTVRDNRGAAHADRVQVTVRANKAPVAHAGADRVVTLPENSVTLRGSGSDPDGSIVSYSWKKTSGGSSILAGANTSVLTVSGLSAGTYEFALTVKDNYGDTHSDRVKVKVNVAPVANAGPDKVINLPQNYVALEGTVSDGDGSIASVVWHKISGGPAKLSGNKTTSLKASDLVPGMYEFRLTVRDDDGASHSDHVKVLVNQPPVVDAGEDQVIQLPGNSISFNGTATDPDGVITSWLWSKVSGGNVSWKGRYSSRLEVDDLQEGTYVFRLRAMDNHGAAAVDDVMISVMPEANIAPVADAGPDKLIVLPENAVTLAGNAEDTDGYITAYVWSQIDGAPVSAEETEGGTLHLVGLAEGEYVFRLTVTDNRGETHSDDVTVIVIEDTSDEPGPLMACGSCEFVIWNSALQRLHDGPWEDDTNQKVFTRGGLYYYNVRLEGKVIKRGKIFRRID